MSVFFSYRILHAPGDDLWPFLQEKVVYLRVRQLTATVSDRIILNLLFDLFYFSKVHQSLQLSDLCVRYLTANIFTPWTISLPKHVQLNDRMVQIKHMNWFLYYSYTSLRDSAYSLCDWSGWWVQILHYPWTTCRVRGVNHSCSKPKHSVHHWGTKHFSVVAAQSKLIQSADHLIRLYDLFLTSTFPLWTSSFRFRGVSPQTDMKKRTNTSVCCLLQETSNLKWHPEEVRQARSFKRRVFNSNPNIKLCYHSTVNINCT